jgi:hypothetical protein
VSNAISPKNEPASSRIVRSRTATSTTPVAMKYMLPPRSPRRMTRSPGAAVFGRKSSINSSRSWSPTSARTGNFSISSRTLSCLARSRSALRSRIALNVRSSAS